MKSVTIDFDKLSPEIQARLEDNRRIIHNYPSDYPILMNSYDETEILIANIIVEKLGVDPSEVCYDSSLTNDLGADDLDSIELIMQFEKEFNISITDEDAERIGTVGEIIALIKTFQN